jgi:hypothetical protein
MLFVFSAALELVAQHPSERASVGSMLLAVYLGFWSYVLGIVGLLLLSVRWIQGRLRKRGARAAMSGSSPGEPPSRDLVKPAPEAQPPDQSVLSGGSTRSTRETDGNKTTSRAKVA